MNYKLLSSDSYNSNVGDKSGDMGKVTDYRSINDYL